jgi:hypothetical protein
MVVLISAAALPLRAGFASLSRSARLHDEVLLEEAEGLFGRRGSEADERGVEVFEHLPPEIVDGAVAVIPLRGLRSLRFAFGVGAIALGGVGDDEVEFLDGERGVVFDGDGFLEEGFGGLPPGHARVLPS